MPIFSGLPICWRKSQAHAGQHGDSASSLHCSLANMKEKINFPKQKSSI